MTQTMEQVLVFWRGLQPSQAIWVDRADLHHQIPDFCLEHKANFPYDSIVMEIDEGGEGERQPPVWRVLTKGALQAGSVGLAEPIPRRSRVRSRSPVSHPRDIDKTIGRNPKKQKHASRSRSLSR